mmetsp:Transcript_32345/g.58736  ORF Transcript_32345/g.58736 Transcript_32345/m.58736 type:complete len:245 (+) Transcript_32345:58-792(+)
MSPLALLALSLLALAASEEKDAASYKKVGSDFLEENKKREGVVALKSGLQYKVLKKGDGKFHPKKDTSCSCHYAGTTLSLTPNAIDIPEADWKEFDSSYKRGDPTSFAPNQVIKAWTEAMQLMVEGDKWELYIPSKLGYGDGGSGEKIKGGEMLIFRMEMIKIEGSGKVKAVHCDFASRENCDPEEIEALDAWGKVPVEELKDKVESLKAQLKGTLKSGIRETVSAQLKVLKKIQKARSKGVEL